VISSTERNKRILIEVDHVSIANVLDLASPNDAWLNGRNPALDAALRASFTDRSINFRLLPWRYHDLLVARYLAAFLDSPARPVIVTGDSTLAQNNLPPNETTAGALASALRRRIGATAPPVLNVATDGTAESFLLVSIRAALALNPSVILAGVTIRDFTQLNANLIREPEAEGAFMRPTGIFNDFMPPDQSVNEATLRQTRLGALQLLRAAGPEFLTTGPELLACAAASLEEQSGYSPHTKLALFASELRYFYRRTTGQYLSDAKLQARINDKNTHKKMLLEDNVFIKRLDYVMRQLLPDKDRIVWQLMPLNGDIDVDKFGLDPEIPNTLERMITELAKKYGYRSISGGAIWPGSHFSLDDVVHLNDFGSLRMARIIADSGAIPEFAKFNAYPYLGAAQSEYEAFTDATTAARHTRIVGCRTHLVGVNAHPFIAGVLRGPGVLHFTIDCVLPSDAPHVFVSPADGSPAMHLRLNGPGTVRVDHRDGHVMVTADGRTVTAAMAMPILRIGYLDTSTADRECILTLLEIESEGTIWDPVYDRQSWSRPPIHVPPGEIGPPTYAAVNQKLVISDFTQEFRRRTDPETAARFITSGGNRAHLLAIGVQPFLALPVVADGVAYAVLEIERPGDAAHVVVSSSTGQHPIVVRMAETGTVSIERTGKRIRVRANQQTYEAEIDQPVVRIGYFQADSADREFVVSMFIERSAQPMFNATAGSAAWPLWVPGAIGSASETAMAAAEPAVTPLPGIAPAADRSAPLPAASADWGHAFTAEAGAERAGRSLKINAAEGSIYMVALGPVHPYVTIPATLLDGAEIDCDITYIGLPHQPPRLRILAPGALASSFELATGARGRLKFGLAAGKIVITWSGARYPVDVGADATIQFGYFDNLLGDRDLTMTVSRFLVT
jgi:hypothetical protein